MTGDYLSELEIPFAYSSVADRAEALSAGYQEHVAKPAHPHQIARVIARLRLPDSRA